MFWNVCLCVIVFSMVRIIQPISLMRHVLNPFFIFPNSISPLKSNAHLECKGISEVTFPKRFNTDADGGVAEIPQRYASLN